MHGELEDAAFLAPHRFAPEDVETSLGAYGRRIEIGS
jgi:hypothetical protein